LVSGSSTKAKRQQEQLNIQGQDLLERKHPLNNPSPVLDDNRIFDPSNIPERICSTMVPSSRRANHPNELLISMNLKITTKMGEVVLRLCVHHRYFLIRGYADMLKSV
jgi:hypothetical protein